MELAWVLDDQPYHLTGAKKNCPVSEDILCHSLDKHTKS